MLFFLIMLYKYIYITLFFFSSRRRHTRSTRDWSSDVCSSDLGPGTDCGSTGRPACCARTAPRSAACSPPGSAPAGYWVRRTWAAATRWATRARWAGSPGRAPECEPRPGASRPGEPMRLGLRYDMRVPEFGAPPAGLYAAAVEQCAWADQLGFDYVHLAEHHGAEDGYCPSPLILGAAIASATRNLQLRFSALVLTMHDPLRLAEDLAVLDLISGGGRIRVIAGIGYRPHEFAMFGVDFAQRARQFEQKLEVLRQAWTGEPFAYRGTTVRVTPTPCTPGGPAIYLGGSAVPSARRAARLGYGYCPTSEELYEVY